MKFSSNLWANLYKQREIEVFEIGLVNFNGTDEITFICRVSKGTYVRTLAEDIAAKLGCVGHLVELTRVKIGKYSLENSVKANDAKAEDLISVDEMLKDFPTEFVSDEDEFRLVREKYPDSFVDEYNNGMEQFKKGNWFEAKNSLNNAQKLIGEEDPAIKLNLEFMEKYNFVAPDNWKGYREEE